MSRKQILTVAALAAMTTMGLAGTAQQAYAQGDEAQVEQAKPPAATTPAEGEAGEASKPAKRFWKQENETATLEGQSIGLVEWTADQGKTWNPGSGKDAVQIPPVLTNYSIGFRVTKGNPHEKWPRTEDEFYPLWTIVEYGKKPRTLTMAGTVWVAFENIAPEGMLNATVAVECGNKITMAVYDVYSNDDDF